MNNKKKYVNAFVETFGVSAAEAEKLEYSQIEEWDSVGHMSLVAALEDIFGIMMDADDIIDFSSFEKGQEILEEKYQIKM